MLRRTNLVFRLLVMVFMAFGLGTLMTSSAAAQAQTVQCQTIIDGEIDQQDCVVTVTGDGQCQVVLESGEIQQNIACSPEGCPQQLIDEDGNIFQFQCDGVPVTPTPVTVTPTPITPTPVTVTPTPVTPGVTVTPTPVIPGATVTPTPVTPDGGQANPPEEEMEVSVLPETGQGPDSDQSNSANVLLLGAMGAVLTLGAVTMRMRGTR
jgi:hypothetical protein